jgi:hypothetical protein
MSIVHADLFGLLLDCEYVGKVAYDPRNKSARLVVVKNILLVTYFFVGFYFANTVESFHYFKKKLYNE